MPARVAALPRRSTSSSRTSSSAAATSRSAPARSQFRAGARVPGRAAAPWLAVPGNHDVPLCDLVRRVFSPLGRYRRYITDDRAPARELPGLRVLGLDSTRRKVVGRLKPRPAARRSRRWRGGDPEDLRVLVTHHPLVRRAARGRGGGAARGRGAPAWTCCWPATTTDFHVTAGATPARARRGAEPDPRPAGAEEGPSTSITRRRRAEIERRAVAPATGSRSRPA